MNSVNEEHLAHRDQIANEGIVTIAVAVDREEQILVGDSPHLGGRSRDAPR